jgi:hypothetical protein
MRYRGGPWSETNGEKRTYNKVLGIARDHLEYNKAMRLTYHEFGQLSPNAGYGKDHWTMSKDTLRPGSFLAIPIGDLGFGYARVIVHEYLAFYDYYTQVIETDLLTINKQEILFKILVSDNGVREWPVIGVLPLEARLNEPIVRFRQKSEDFTRCVIYDTSGMERKATPAECVGLEPGIVWEKEGAEERLTDALLRRPNRVVERYKVRLAQDWSYFATVLSLASSDLQLALLDQSGHPRWSVLLRAMERRLFTAPGTE